MAYPQQDFTNDAINPNISHETIEIKTIVIVEIFPFSFLTYTLKNLNI